MASQKLIDVEVDWQAAKYLKTSVKVHFNSLPEIDTLKPDKIVKTTRLIPSLSLTEDGWGCMLSWSIQDKLNEPFFKLIDKEGSSVEVCDTPVTSHTAVNELFDLKGYNRMFAIDGVHGSIEKRMLGSLLALQEVARVAESKGIYLWVATHGNSDVQETFIIPSINKDRLQLANGERTEFRVRLLRPVIAREDSRGG